MTQGEDMTSDLSQRFLRAMEVERERITSRRSLLGKSAMVGGGVAALAVAGIPAFRASAQGLEADPLFETDIDVLNYALTLEHLETVLYRDALATFAPADFGAESVYPLLEQIGAHEAAHVEALTAAISDLGGEPVAEGTYDFGYTDVATFLATAAAIENVGVAAYAGAAPSLVALTETPALVTAALGIHSVEARHASFVAALINDADNQPFPNAVDAPLTPAEVLEIATPFIVGADSGTPEATPTA
jgi:hypothetical protein